MITLKGTILRPKVIRYFSSAGGNVGLMGEIASTVYAGLGEENVIGVIPEALQPREVPFYLSACTCM